MDLPILLLRQRIFTIVISIAVGLGGYRTKYEDLFLDGLGPSNYRIILCVSY